MFHGDDVNQESKTYRVVKDAFMMIKLLLEPVNFIDSDEPSNQFNMKTTKILSKMHTCDGWNINSVSHDRDFFDGLANKGV
jgi:ATP-binding cassette subfamily F protein 3